jgi:hypothetical protein
MRKSIEMLQKEDGMLLMASLIPFFFFLIFLIFNVNNNKVEKETNELNQRIENDYTVMMLVKDRTYREFFLFYYFFFFYVIVYF